CVKEKHCIFGEVVGDAALSVPFVRLTPEGKTVQFFVENTSAAYSGVSVASYVIMPNHVHILLLIHEPIAHSNKDGTLRAASPTKTAVPQIIRAVKSLTTRKLGHSIWQRSYHEHVVRDFAEFRKISEYIDNNPQTWADDKYFTRERL
ncbi:MAG: transposase, partial [Oscillospiraceae bacterium]|nr:transposase [Oscillospiraceae bacterium]